VKILFATDVHGSEKCFKKFLNLGKLTKSDFLILGGDITGKVIVPIVREADGNFSCEYLGQPRKVKPGKEIEELEKQIRFSGHYPYITDATELEELNASPERRDELFKRLMIATLQNWIKLAEEKLKDTGIPCYMTGGNDDLFEVEQVLRSSKYVIDPEGEVINVGGYEMISSGYSNITPWKTPRELPEDQLLQLIEKMATQVTNMNKTIFNLHVPPFDSTLDLAPKLDTTVYPPRPHHVGTQPVMEPVGSKAVRAAIEKYSPLIGLHGHIHESKGMTKIGRTVCFNPGSEYGDGTIQYVLVILSEDRVDNFQFCSG